MNNRIEAGLRMTYSPPHSYSVEAESPCPEPV